MSKKVLTIQNDSDCDIRLIAVKKLTDEETLKIVALNDDVWHVRKLAVEKLTDEETLIAIINKSTDIDIQVIAIQKLSKSSLRKIKSDDWYIKAIINDIFGTLV